MLSLKEVKRLGKEFGFIAARFDLVSGKTERIESRFLEPACGNVNFIIEVLKWQNQCSPQCGHHPETP